MKKKKLDIFNLFYSGAAVVILIGVIAKLLEWPAQDILITGGLAIEAVVFGVSAVKFVEVEEKQEVATEATLSKVADGLGNLASNAASLGLTGDTYVNIQTGNSTEATANDLKIGSSTYPDLEPKLKVTTYPEAETKLSIDIQSPVSSQQPPSSNSNANATHTLWQLEQLDILSLSKDLFYQPEWSRLSSEEYLTISSLFKRLFNKKVPTKESLPFLAQFPVKIPIPEIASLELVATSNLETNELEVICKAFEVIKVNNLFEYFMIEKEGPEITIRHKQPKETIVYGGEEEAILSHCINFHSKELVLSPVLECLIPIIKLKDHFLVDFLIQKVDIKNEAEFISLSEVLTSKSDDFKRKLFNKFKKVKYNTQTDAGYVYLKTLTKLAASFNDPIIAQELIAKLIELQVNEELNITITDVVNSYADTIYFGPKNEYSVVLKDIFINGELDYISHFSNLIEKLAGDGVAHKSKLTELFTLKEHDSKKEIFNKLNYHLAKTNTVAGGAQLAFILLYKQYS